MAEPTAHTHILKMTHTKPIVAQPSEWLAGKVKRSVIPSRQMQEPLRGTEAFSEMQTITQTNSYVVPLPSLLLPLQTFFF